MPVARPSLLLDIGNSAVKWRIQAGRYRIVGRQEYTAGFDRALKAQWSQSPQWSDRSESLRWPAASQSCDGPAWQVVYSSVAKKKFAELVLGLAGQCFAGEQHMLRAQAQTALGLGEDRIRVDSQYRQPMSLGADRWAAVLGLAAQGRRLRPLLAPRRATPKGGRGGSQAGSGDAAGLSPVWLVSAGTATVVDLVWARADDDGRLWQLSHQGGLILPGIGLMREALSASTGALGPYVQASAQAALFKGVPRQSHQAIARGIAAAQLGALLVLPRPSAVFIHGGYAQDWRRCLRMVWSAMPGPQKAVPQIFAAPELVLDGLAQWAKTLSARQLRPQGLG